jgi:hypothetical protein
MAKDRNTKLHLKRGSGSGFAGLFSDLLSFFTSFSTFYGGGTFADYEFAFLGAI